MKISWAWIKDYIEPNQNALELIDDILIQAGIEFTYYNPYANFEVVTIDSISKIEGSKNLNLCKIKDKQIVCGASNAREGLRCILANIGSVVPSNGILIKESVLYGHVSQGMLCGSSELLLEDSDGLYEVKDNEDILLKLSENGPFFDLDLTPNRGDLLSAYGIARELAAFGLGKLKKPNIFKSDNINNFLFQDTAEYLKIIDNQSVKSMYNIRLNIDQNRKMPMNLIKRLYEVGIGTKNSIVDVTNYIAHALGQPLHAFDYQVTGNIKFAKSTGVLKDLKGLNHTIENVCCVVNQDDVICAIPGVIGGDNSKINDHSTQILLEAGTYSQDHICVAQKFTPTSASKKFLYGVDFNMTKIAIEEAAHLMLQINKGEILKCEENKKYDYIPKFFHYNPDIIDIKLSQEFVDSSLLSLGFKKANDSYEVPSWRYNEIMSNEHLTETVLRLYGYQNIPEVESRYLPQIISYKQAKLPMILAALGLNEIQTYDFMSKKMNKYFKQDQDFNIINPMKPDNQYCMRNTILPGLIETACMYLRYHWMCKGLFEIGNIFNKNGQFQKAGILIFEEECEWVNKNKLEYFRAKGIFETAIQIVYPTFTMQDNGSDIVFDEKCVFFNKDMQEIGVFGVLSKTIKEAYKIKGNVYLGEFNLSDERVPKIYKTTSDHMCISRDISFYVKNKLSYHDIHSAILSLNHPINIKIFDIYPNTSLSNPDRSYAIRITWTSLTHTLTTEEINQVIKSIEDKLVDLGCAIKL